ncbi:MAG: hypothetical protein E6X86_01850 [Clostridium butyricum]|nr:hypothetical protein [Clostridium butyricum]MDU4853696.1 hypothetical protein [Clostridioides difficile]
MLMKYPIKFDENITLFFQDGTNIITNVYPTSNSSLPCKFSKKISGYDSSHNRITNLVGFDGIEFLKQCSRSNCCVVLKASDFGPWGRTMANAQHRDQSNCPSCRSNY